MPKFEQNKGFSSMFNKKINNAFPGAVGDSYSPFQQNKKKKNTLEDKNSKLTVDEEGNKFYIDSEGKKHTGQVSDVEYEKNLDKDLHKKEKSPAKQNTHAYEVDDEYYATREEAEQARKKLKSKKEEVPSENKQKHSYTKKAGTNVTGKYTNFAQGVPMYGKYTPEKFVLGETKPKPSIYDHYDELDERKKSKESPAKQEGPIDKKQLKLQPSENKDTWVYEPKKGKEAGSKFDLGERIGDLEDRISFIKEDASAAGKPLSNQQKKDIAKLTQEAQILRKRRGDKTK